MNVLLRLMPGVLGELTLPAGEHTIVVRAKQIAGGNLMRLRRLELTPAE